MTADGSRPRHRCAGCGTVVVEEERPPGSDVAAQVLDIALGPACAACRAKFMAWDGAEGVAG